MYTWLESDRERRLQDYVDGLLLGGLDMRNTNGQTAKSCYDLDGLRCLLENRKGASVWPQQGQCHKYPAQVDREEPVTVHPESQLCSHPEFYGQAQDDSAFVTMVNSPAGEFVGQHPSSSHWHHSRVPFKWMDAPETNANVNDTALLLQMLDAEYDAIVGSEKVNHDPDMAMNRHLEPAAEPRPPDLPSAFTLVQPYSWEIPYVDNALSTLDSRSRVFGSDGYGPIGFWRQNKLY